MLFYIDEDIVIQAEMNNEHVIRILDDLATSVFYGRHIFYCIPPLLKRLNCIQLFAARTKHVFAHWLSRFADFGSIINKINTYIRFRITDQVISLDKINNANVIDVPIGLVKDDSIFMQTVLLFENLNDFSLYDIVLKYYKKKHELNFCPSEYIIDTGGGNCTNEAYKNIIEQNKICLCIVDSDKKYPSASKGETYSKLSRVETCNSWLLCKLVSLEHCREMENMIPFGVLKDIADLEISLKKVYDLHEKFQEINPSAFLYLDLKSGLKVSSYKNIKKDNKQYLNFIEDILIKSKISTKDDLKAYDKDVDDEKYIYNGFGGKIASKIVSFINENDIVIVDSMFVDKQEEEWLTIGSYLTDWTCSMQPIRS